MHFYALICYGCKINIAFFSLIHVTRVFYISTSRLRIYWPTTTIHSTFRCIRRILDNPRCTLFFARQNFHAVRTQYQYSTILLTFCPEIITVQIDDNKMLINRHDGKFITKYSLVFRRSPIKYWINLWVRWKKKTTNNRDKIMSFINNLNFC